MEMDTNKPLVNSGHQACAVVALKKYGLDPIDEDDPEWQREAIRLVFEGDKVAFESWVNFYLSEGCGAAG